MALIPNDFDIDTDLQKNEYKIALIPNDFALFRYELSATKVANWRSDPGTKGSKVERQILVPQNRDALLRIYLLY